MKKIFAFLFASALLATGLISCGGGGDDDSRDIVTAQQFLSGKGMTFLGGSPSWSILPNQYTNIGNIQKVEDGRDLDVSSYFKLNIYDVDDLHQSGRVVNQTRRISFLGANTGSCDVTYIYTQEGYAIMKLSVGDDISSTSAAINAFGFAQSLDDVAQDSYTVSSIGGCEVSILIDWKSRTAQAEITARTASYTVIGDDADTTRTETNVTFTMDFTVVAVSE